MTAPLPDYFDRAQAAADRLSAYQATLGDPPRNQHDEDTRLLCRAFTESRRLNAGLRAENAGLSARLSASAASGDLPAPDSPTQALVAAARAVLAAVDPEAQDRYDRGVNA